MNTSSDKTKNAPAADASDPRNTETVTAEHSSRDQTATALPAYMRADADEPASPRAAVPQEAAAPEQSDGERQGPAPSSPSPAAAQGLGEALEKAREEAESVIAVAPDGSAVREQAPLDESAPSPAKSDGSPQEHDASRTGSPLPPPAGANEKQDKDSKKKRPAAAAPRSAGASFAQTHPILAVEQTMPPSLGSRLYNGFALLPLLPLTVLLLLQVLFSLDARHLWFPDEVRFAALFQNLLEHGKGLVLELSGAPYAEKSPLYFWLLRGLFGLLPTSGPVLYFSAAALSALLYLWAALGLGRLVGRVNGRTNFAAGIILLSTTLVMGVIHYAGMDILCAALLLSGHIALYRAFARSRQSPALMAAAFVLSGLAALMNGPFLLAVPLLSVILFALWRGTPKRLLRPDLAFGFAAGLLTIGLWPALVLLFSDKEQGGTLLQLLLAAQVTTAFTQMDQLPLAWLGLARRLPFLLLPWAILLFFLPWNRLFSRATREGLAASRRPEKEGLAFLWCMAIASFCLLPLFGTGSCGGYLPLLPPLAILAARPLLALSGTRAPALRYSLAALFFLFGITFIVGGLMFFDILPKPSLLPQWTLEAHGGFFIAGALCLVTAGLLWLGLGSSRPEGVLLLVALAAAGLGYPLASLVAPSFDPALSPQAQARLLRAYADKGYAVAAYQVQRGSYDFYAGMPIPELPALDDAPALGGGKSVLALPLAEWEGWEGKPDAFKEISRHWMGRSSYVLVSPEPLADLPLAPVPYAAAPDIMAELLARIGLGAVDSPAPGPEEKPSESGPDRPEQGADAAAPAPAASSQEQSSPAPAPAPQAPAADERQEHEQGPAATETKEEPATDKNATPETPPTGSPENAPAPVHSPAQATEPLPETQPESRDPVDEPPAAAEPDENDSGAGAPPPDAPDATGVPGATDEAPDASGGGAEQADDAALSPVERGAAADEPGDTPAEEEADASAHP